MVLEVKKPRPLWEIIFSTHHTDIGLLYIISSITFLMMGGALALAIRSELFLPGQQIIPDPNTFHRFFTVHGTTMLFLWAIPFGAGIGNYLIPILVRYKDMAWPKLNAVAFWMIPVGAAMVWIGFADLGWTAYPPYSIIRAPGPAAELWIFGLKILGLSSVLGSINFIVTMLKCKHPDLPIMKMSLFAWSILSISFMTLVAIPTFAAALIMLYTDRLGVTGFFNPALGGDPIAYQHLFWFTFHPEVYIFLLPAVGMLYEMIPKFSRKPIFSYQSGVIAFLLLSTIGFASWAHHMLATGMSFTEKTVFMVGTLAAVAGGVVNTALPLDFITHDSYWVVGHFHLILMGTVSLTFTGFLYYMFPLITGRMYNEKLARIHFVAAFGGVIMVFITQHLLGLYGMPRRYFDYIPLPEWIAMNQIATTGAWIVGFSYLLMIFNFLKSSMSGVAAQMRDPFKIGEEYYDYRRRDPHH